MSHNHRRKDRSNHNNDGRPGPQHQRSQSSSQAQPESEAPRPVQKAEPIRATVEGTVVKEPQKKGLSRGWLIAGAVVFGLLALGIIGVFFPG